MTPCPETNGEPAESVRRFNLQRSRLCSHRTREPTTPFDQVPSAASLDAQLDYRYRRARQDAEVEMRRFLPSNPRTAKRMLNHFSLAMAIAEQRGLFHDGEITQQHLVKWIGISEQWPALAAALTTNTTRMAQLEQLDRRDEIQDVLDQIAPGTVASDELIRRLHDGPKLGDLLERLVGYEPGQT